MLEANLLFSPVKSPLVCPVPYAGEWTLWAPVFEPIDCNFDFDKYYGCYECCECYECCQRSSDKPTDKVMYHGGIYGNHHWNYLLEHRGFKIYADIYCEIIFVSGDDRELTYKTELSAEDFRILESWKYPELDDLFVQIAVEFIDCWLAEKLPEGQLELGSSLQQCREFAASRATWDIQETMTNAPNPQGFCVEYLKLLIPYDEGITAVFAS